MTKKEKVSLPLQCFIALQIIPYLSLPLVLWSYNDVGKLGRGFAVETISIAIVIPIALVVLTNCCNDAGVIVNGEPTGWYKELFILIGLFFILRSPSIYFMRKWSIMHNQAIDSQNMPS